MDKKKFLQIIIAVAVFWIADYTMHMIGVGESNYYFLSKLANSILFAVLFFFLFNFKEHWKKIAFSLVFGTWVSSYYLITSYSGAVQNFFGIVARYTPPPFVIGSLVLTPYLWWVFHGLMFYIGLEIAGLLEKKPKKNKK